MRTLVSALAPLFLAALAACTSDVPQPVQTVFDPPYPERNDAGDGIVAAFEGRVPCLPEGCRTRKVQVVFYGDKATGTPTTYWLGVVHVGLGDERTVATGRWTEVRGTPTDPSARIWTLDGDSDPTLRNFWMLDDEVVAVLDADRRPQRGDGAFSYALNRKCTPWGPITYPYDEKTGQFLPTKDLDVCAKQA